MKKAVILKPKAFLSNPTLLACLPGILLAGLMPTFLMLQSCSPAQSPKSETALDPVRDRGQNVVENDADKTATVQKNSSFDPKKVFSEDTLLDSFYRMDSVAMGGQFCKGESRLKFYTALKKDQPIMEVPEGSLDCGPLGKLDLLTILGAFTVNLNDGTSERRNNFIRVKKLGSVSYSPARPVLPSFLSSKPADLANLNIVANLEAFDEKLNIKSMGTIQISMIKFGQEFRSRELNYTFRDVMTFEIVTSGFNELDKTINYLFDRMEWTVALNPLAVLAIKFESPAHYVLETFKNNPAVLSKQMEALIKTLPTGDGTGVLDGLIGKDVDDALKTVKLEFTMTLIDQRNLGSKDEMNRASDHDDQVQVGKQ